MFSLSPLVVDIFPLMFLRCYSVLSYSFLKKVFAYFGSNVNIIFGRFSIPEDVIIPKRCVVLVISLPSEVLKLRKVWNFITEFWTLCHRFAQLVSFKYLKRKCLWLDINRFLMKLVQQKPYFLLQHIPFYHIKKILIYSIQKSVLEYVSKILILKTL